MAQFHAAGGSREAGHRPALVLSPAAYNGETGLLLCCPITSQVEGYPFEVALDPEAGVRGVVLSDQVKSPDWRARQARRKGAVSKDVMDQTIARVRTLPVTKHAVYEG